MSFQAKQQPLHPVQQLPIFVYGTLRKGEPNYQLLRGHTILEKIAVVEHINLYEYNDFPVAVPGTNRLVGEIMTIAPRMYTRILTAIDLLEGYCKNNPVQSTYERVVVQAICADQRVVACWIYLWQGTVKPHYHAIQSGDWIEYRQDKIVRARKTLRTENYD